MKRFIAVAAIAAFVFVCATSPARADDASKAAKAEELLKLVQGDQIMKSVEPMITSMAGMAGSGMSGEERARFVQMQQKILALVSDRLNKATPTLAKVYSDTYTEAELDGILAFYKSPIGRSFLQKMPEVTQRMTPVMMSLIVGLQPEIKKLTEEMRQPAK